jgi:alpha-glucosidase
MTLKGTVLMFQGEELGLPDGPIERHQIHDPVGELYFPYSKGRDPCRTPMPWVEAKPNIGFTYGEPWLPMAPAHRALAAATQERDEGSTLHFARKLISLRKSSPALQAGDIRILEASDQVLAFERTLGEQRSTCVFNLSRKAATSAVLPAGAPLLTVGDVQADGARLNLGPLSAIIA